MNGKRAKYWRRMAESFSVGKPEKEYEIAARGRPIIGLDGLPRGRHPDSLRLIDGCTRTIYLVLKQRRSFTHRPFVRRTPA